MENLKNIENTEKMRDISVRIEDLVQALTNIRNTRDPSETSTEDIREARTALQKLISDHPSDFDEVFKQAIADLQKLADSTEKIEKTDIFASREETENKFGDNNQNANLRAKQIVVQFQSDLTQIMQFYASNEQDYEGEQHHYATLQKAFNFK